ncbi:TetR/AcrR family transcriptional regulator [Phyllobacterium sp. SB3]|uniref:TetR/AcrR family transcriptional regulator n=1 Tax=Phyllobacterium sp. SB3 TaxID=3156073 RepID=UPI0032AFDAEF
MVHLIGVMMNSKARRRRGADLDEAILDATWEELADKGYLGLTLETVAKRAGTSRPVLHRRWESRGELVTAALARHVARNPISVPDQGSVRDEMILLLQRLSDRARPELLRIVFDMREDLLEARSNLADLTGRIGERGVVTDILVRGVERREIDAARITPRIASLPIDLARHDMLMTLQPLSSSSIHEIVDEIFLPLIARTPS